MPFTLIETSQPITLQERKRLMLRLLVDYGPLTLQEMASRLQCYASSLSYAQYQLEDAGVIHAIGLVVGRDGPAPRIWGIVGLHHVL